jgi:hypothetical protein
MEFWNPGWTWMSPEHPVNLDAGHPCRHDEDLHFHLLQATSCHFHSFPELRDLTFTAVRSRNQRNLTLDLTAGSFR